MQSDLPKALIPLKGKPLIRHVLDAIPGTQQTKPIIVVGQKREQIIEALGSDFQYAIQHEQLGTGHAVLSAKDLLSQSTDSVLVFYADQPFITPATICALVDARRNASSKISMATVELSDFAEWRSAFLGFSRVLRDDTGKILRVVEAKDATDAEKEIREVNPAYFCFDQAWLLESLPKIKNQNAQGEYYLTDLVKFAFEEGIEIPSVRIDAREALGTNSREDIANAEMI